jgi:hypothetical protein
MTSISIIALKTISRRTITITLRNTRRKRAARIRTGSITRSIERAPSIRTSRRLRSMGSSVRVEAPDQPPQRPEGTAVAQVRKVVEGHKRATPVVAGGKRALLVAAAEEANVRRAIAARRAAVLLPGVEEPPVAAAEAAVVVAVVKQEVEKTKD